MVHMDLSPHVISENALLAERSFISEQNETSVTNGHHLDSVNRSPKCTSPRSREGPSMVSVVRHLKIPLYEYVVLF